MLNDEADVLAAAAVREEHRSRDDPDAVLGGALIASSVASHARERQPREEAAARPRPLDARRASCARARRASARTCAGRARATLRAARRSSRGGRTPRRAAARARPRTGRCSASPTTSCAEISAGPTAQPSRTPGKNVFDVVPACTTASGARLQRLGGVSSSKPSSRYATSSTIRKPYRRASSTSASRRSAERRHAGRILVVRDRVEELRAQPRRRAGAPARRRRARPRPSALRRPPPRSRGTP